MLDERLRGACPFFRVLSDGEYAGNAMSFQEFMIASVGASSLSKAVHYSVEA